MADFGREITFGYFLVPNASDPVLETAREAEQLGYDYIGIQDHPYQRRYVDTWALIAMILAQTSRIRVFPDVANLPLRPPAVLAKAAASLDVLSGGRFELGLGAGAFWDAIEAWGGPRRGARESLDALSEAMKVIRLVFSGERNLRFDGEHYRLSGAQPGPVPAHAIGIWLGTYGPRALKLTARHADGWVPSLQGDLARITDAVARVDEAEADAGRTGKLRRILNVNGTITDGRSEGLLRGPVDQWADELTDLAVGLGFDTFVFWAEGDDDHRRFAAEVIPAVREQVAEERG